MKVKITFQDDRGKSSTKTQCKVIVSVWCDKRPKVLLLHDKLL